MRSFKNIALLVSLLFSLAFAQLPIQASAQVFSQSQIMQGPYWGVVMGDGTISHKATASSSPTLNYFTATSTRHASTFPFASTTETSADKFCINSDSCISSWPTGSGGSGFSTTSSDFWLTQRQGAAFSTTSADWWVSTKNFITGIAWGAITGTLSNQADLNAKFATKLGTSSALTANQVIYATSFNTTASVATGTVSCLGVLGCTSFTVLGGSASISLSGTKTANQMLYFDTGASNIRSVATSSPIFSYPFTTSGTAGYLVDGSGFTIAFSGVSTSAAPTIGNLAYWTSDKLLGTVATTSVICSGTVSCSGFNVLGNSPITITGSAGTSASSTALSDNNTFSGLDTFTKLLTLGAASSTDLSVSHSFFGPNLTNCTGSSFLQWTSSNGNFGCATPATGGGGSGNVSTSSAESAGFLAYWTSNSATPALLGKVSTSTLSASSPLTGSFTQIGSGGALGIQAATAGQAGYETQNEFNYVHSATSTFSAPLVYTTGTNAVTCTNASNGVTGCMSSTDWGLLHTATTTFSSPLSYSGGTNAVTCPTCNTSNATVSSIATTWPITGGTITTTGTLGFNGVATSAAPTIGNLAYWTSDRLLGTVATGTVSAGSSAITVTAGRSVLGGALAIDCATAGSSQTGCISSTDWATFNGKLNFSNLFTIATTFGTTTMSTTTPIWAKTGILASSTSQFDFASSTGGITTANLWNTGLTSVLALFDANHKETAYGGASSCGANNFFTGLSAAGASSCGTAAISGVNLGSNLFSLQPDGTSITGTAFNGSAAVSNWALNMANANSWTAKQTFVGASSTALTVSQTLYTPFTSGLGAFATDNHLYNISTTSMNASITGSAGSVANAHTVSGSITGTSFNGSAAVSDWTLNMANANTWTAKQTFGAASTTDLTASHSFYLPFAGGLVYSDANKLATTIATSSVTCSGNISCTGFAAIGASTISFTGTLGIANGGTATTTATTNAVPYYNGTYFAGNPSLLSFTGTNFGIATSSPYLPFSVFGTAIIQGTSAGTSSIAVTSSSATKGGKVIVQDMTGGTCTEIHTQGGVITSAVVTCP